ncbi:MULTISPECIES: anti-sigma factor family protein [unclassified Nocardioides]|uniref:anti-sigma factor family protein n=1 Tax=unclassified Nocardioides TaxID=2615069 RepID=UPI0006F48DD9|nr:MULTISPECIES: zf-HC2 domain-containing protein [unclassified Nocardioides]KQY64523.1 hypothetical protein ASD30_06280 [Nocardioides sp. Root140]KRF18318.1 hypothetical protein ASH02_01805 [Nocardioides sp. Soil796]
MTDDYSTYDAAYLLGALSPEERRDFETHLRGCADCSASVTRLSGLPGLLAKAPQPDLVDAPGPVPESLLPALLAEVARRRARRRRVVLVATAAAVIIAIAAGAFIGLRPPPPDTDPSAIEMTAVAAGSPVQAEAVLDAKAWGTHIRLHCWYRDTSSYRPGTYRLVVTDNDGTVQQLATWAVVPGETTTVDGSTSLDLDEIATVEVRNRTDKAVLTLSP